MILIEIEEKILLVIEDHISSYCFEVVHSVEFIQILITILISLIVYNIYIVVITYYKKYE